MSISSEKKFPRRIADFSRRKGLYSVSQARIRFGILVTVLGLIIFILGAKPEWLGLDRSSVIGFVQIAVFLIGLATICVGGSVGLAALWGGQEKSIAAAIGLRLVSTGYVVAVFAGMADVFGMGTQPPPMVPFFGPWQAMGVVIGEMVISIGFILMIPFTRYRM
jgi:hypothetical protein